MDIVSGNFCLQPPTSFSKLLETQQDVIFVTSAGRIKLTRTRDQPGVMGSGLYPYSWRIRGSDSFFFFFLIKTKNSYQRKHKEKVYKFKKVSRHCINNRQYPPSQFCPVNPG